jgi:polyisoprenoid-binding protein YceI
MFLRLELLATSSISTAKETSMTTLTQTQEVLPAGAWREDPIHSHVGFEIGYASGTFRGSFAPFEARLDVEPTGAAVLVGEASADSVHVLDENLTAHLLTPDFFDAERAPLLRFESTEVRRAGTGVAISGTLTLRGVSVPVQLEGTIGEPFPHPLGTERLSLDLETTVDRRNFGIVWQLEMPNGEPVLGYDVKLSAGLFLVRQES